MDACNLVSIGRSVQRTAIADPFRNYKPESEKEFKQVNVKEDKTLKQLKKAFIVLQKKQLFDRPGYIVDEPDDICKFARPLLKGINCTSRDITNFVICLDKLLTTCDAADSFGVFVSMLINNCKEKNFIIRTDIMDAPLNHLGYKNRKNLIIENGSKETIVGTEMKEGMIIAEGNVYCGLCITGGKFIVKGNAKMVAWNMENGMIIVEGNAHSGASRADCAVGSSMEGGHVIIAGNVYGAVGFDMRGGEITINGNCDGDIGYGMKGGTIFLEGNYGSLADNIVGGNIFHKGKQIVKNGKVLI